MKRFLTNYRLHENTEALFLLILGIIIQFLDGSPLDIRNRWTLIWETKFPDEYFSYYSEKLIKTVLAVIILIRCMTSILYIIFGFIVVFCIIKESSPNLMLPWLVISGLKSVLLTFLETLTGIYVCSSFGTIRKPCINFIALKAIELFLAIYIWVYICSIRKDLEQYEENEREEELFIQQVIHKVNVCRRRTRSLLDETTLHKTANLNYFELKDVPQIIFDMLKTEEELSQDSLLSPGMMLASISNMGSYDYLKTSSSLGELGFTDLKSFQDDDLDDNRCWSPSKKAMEFLKLTSEDVKKAQERKKRKSFMGNYSVPNAVSSTMFDTGSESIFDKGRSQKEACFTEVFNAENVSQEERNSINTPLRARESFLSVIKEFSFKMNLEGSGGESFVSEEEEMKKDNQNMALRDQCSTPDLWFATNAKDEMNRIELYDLNGTRWSDNYEHVYQGECLGGIGLEVQENASKLLKLTSPRGIDNESEIGIKNSQHKLGSAEIPDSDDGPSKAIGKMKKIVFKFNSQTTIPFGIIIMTTFPMRLDAKPSNTETLHFKSLSSGTTEIIILQNREFISSVEISDVTSSNQMSLSFPLSKCEGQEKCSFDSEESQVRFPDNSPSCDHENTSSNLQIETQANPNECKDQRQDDATILSEQLLLAKHLMKKSINDFLRCCCDLGKLDSVEVRHRGYTIKKIISKEGGEDLKSEMKSQGLDALKKATRWAKKSSYSDNSSKEVTPLIFTGVGRANKEKGSSFMEKFSGNEAHADTTKLCITKTEKIKTTENNFLLPSCLFGSEEQRWSNNLPPKINLTSKSNDGKISNRGENRLQKCFFAYSKTSMLEPLTHIDDSMETENSSNVSETVHCGNKVRNHVSISRALTKKVKVEDSRTFKSSALSDEFCKMTLPSWQDSNSVSTQNKSENPTSMDTSTKVSDNAIVHEAQLKRPLCSVSSKESVSLFYSKTFNFASSLLNTRRFVYPDRIHYDCKNVRKREFDVQLNGKLPLLVRNSLIPDFSRGVKKLESRSHHRTRITSKPMDPTLADHDDFKHLLLNARQNSSAPNTKEAEKIELNSLGANKPTGSSKMYKQSQMKSKIILNNFSLPDQCELPYSRGFHDSKHLMQEYLADDTSPNMKDLKLKKGQCKLKKAYKATSEKASKSTGATSVRLLSNADKYGVVKAQTTNHSNKFKNKKIQKNRL